MAELRSTTSIGGNLVWHGGNLKFNPQGDTIRFKTFKIYTEHDKPTTTEINAVNRAGDFMSGQLVLPRDMIALRGTAFTDSGMYFHSDGRTVIGGHQSSSTGGIQLRPSGITNSNTQVEIDTSGNMTVNGALTNTGAFKTNGTARVDSTLSVGSSISSGGIVSSTGLIQKGTDGTLLSMPDFNTGSYRYINVVGSDNIVSFKRNGANNHDMTMYGQEFKMNERTTISDKSDGWLRLADGSNSYNLGIYTPKMIRADGGLQVGSKFNIPVSGTPSVHEGLNVFGDVWLHSNNGTINHKFEAYDSLATYRVDNKGGWRLFNGSDVGQGIIMYADFANDTFSIRNPRSLTTQETSNASLIRYDYLTNQLNTKFDKSGGELSGDLNVSGDITSNQIEFTHAVPDADVPLDQVDSGIWVGQSSTGTTQGYPIDLLTLINLGVSSNRRIQMIADIEGSLWMRTSHSSDVWPNGWSNIVKFYTERDKPTADDVGALSLNGGTINGDVSATGHINSDSGLSVGSNFNVRTGGTTDIFGTTTIHSELYLQNPNNISNHRFENNNGISTYRVDNTGGWRLYNGSGVGDGVVISANFSNNYVEIRNPRTVTPQEQASNSLARYDYVNEKSHQEAVNAVSEGVVEHIKSVGTRDYHLTAFLIAPSALKRYDEDNVLSDHFRFVGSLYEYRTGGAPRSSETRLNVHTGWEQDIISMQTNAYGCRLCYIKHEERWWIAFLTTINPQYTSWAAVGQLIYYDYTDDDSYISSYGEYREKFLTKIELYNSNTSTVVDDAYNTMIVINNGNGNSQGATIQGLRNTYGEQFYSPTYKPSPDDIGALSLTGGELTGPLGITTQSDNTLYLRSAANNDITIRGRKTDTQGFYIKYQGSSPTNTLCFGTEDGADKDFMRVDRNSTNVKFTGNIYANVMFSSISDTSTVSGAIAYRESNSDPIRFCNSPSAVRDWLQVSESNASKQDILQSIYDVGDIFISLSSANPSLKFGGTWVLIDNDTSLMAGTSDNVTGNITGTNAPAVPLLAHTHNITVNATDLGNKNTNQAGYHSHEYELSRAYDARGTAGNYFGNGQHISVRRRSGKIYGNGNHGHVVTIGAHGHSASASTTGTNSPTLDVRGQRLYVYMWRKTA